MEFLRTFGLFVATALAEIIGCYLPWLWLRQGRSVWLLVPAALALALFVWLLSLHPNAAGRVYAAYGGVYPALPCSGCGSSIQSAPPLLTCLAFPSVSWAWR